MGLPSYIINHDEITDVIKSILTSSNLKIDINIVNNGSTVSIGLNTDVIEEETEKLINAKIDLVTDYIDWNSTIYHFESVLRQLLTKHKLHVQSLNANVKKVSDDYIEIVDVLKKIDGYLARPYNQTISSYSLFIPSIKGTFTRVIRINSDRYLYQLDLKLSSLNRQDKISLKVNNKYYLQNVSIKNLHVHKRFKKYISVKQNDNVIVEYINNSAEHKNIYIEL